MEHAMPETASCSRRFGGLRGVRWRADLGILPSSPSAAIDDLRRVTADSRRRYAALRRQLLVDPHVSKDGSNSPDLVIDNPLSQNPDSMWGRFFRNAELEKMVDQDLTRLYPERGSYFQTSGCQGNLRRILLLWCLSHPEYGYRQGMHELLAPLLYVLHVDIECLSEVRKSYEDHFVDKFDGFGFHENDLIYKFKFPESVEDGSQCKKPPKIASITELDPVIQTIILLSDAYGAEGELGIVLSEKFMEHDAYSMFDALMSGAGGAVAMAEFFSLSPYRSSHSMFTPVIEASAAMYHLLSMIDSSLHTHLVELGVEPQYFSLRWLRVLFGREFSLEDLLLIWDEIFACDNTRFMKADDTDSESNFGVLSSLRGAFISAFAVSMILMLRSSLLATETATSCLQRLLNFPDDASLVKLVEKAKSLQTLAVDVNKSSSLLLHPGLYDEGKPGASRGYTNALDSSSPRTPLSDAPESYWEEKWRVLHKEEEYKQDGREEKVPRIRKGWSERVKKLHPSRTESDPYSPTKNEKTNIPDASVRRSLLNDLARQLELDNNEENPVCIEDVEHQDLIEVTGQDVTNKTPSDMLSGVGSKENCPVLSNPLAPNHKNIDHDNVSEKSSVASNSSVDGNCFESSRANPKSSSLRVTCTSSDESSRCTQNGYSTLNSPKLMRFTRTLSDKFNWLKLGRNTNEGTSERPSISEGVKVSSCENDRHNVTGCSVADGCDGERPSVSEGAKVSSGEIDRHNVSGCSVADGRDGERPSVSEGAKVSGGEIHQHSVVCCSVADRYDGEEPSVSEGSNASCGEIDRHNVACCSVADACDGERPSVSEGTKVSNSEIVQHNVAGYSVADGCDGSSGDNKGESVDQNLMVSLRNLGQSMLKNIQVIESVFQQDHGQINLSKNGFVDEGEVTAMAALKELRKISSILCEM